jgi:hypothetical protein
MASRNAILAIHYIERPRPVLIVAFLERRKKELNIIHEEIMWLEPYQVDNGNLKDERVIAERILALATRLEIKIRSGLHFIVQSPRILSYGVILPKMNVRKARQLSQKEIDEMLVKHEEYYVRNERLIDKKEKGVMVYTDFLPIDLLNSLVNLGDHLDRLIESVTVGIHGLAGLIPDVEIDQQDMFLLTADEYTAKIALFIDGQFIDGLTVFMPASDDDRFTDEVMKSVRLLSGKHQFAFEREDIKELVMVVADDTLADAMTKEIEEALNMTVTRMTDLHDAALPYAALLSNAYLDYTFDIKG